MNTSLPLHIAILGPGLLGGSMLMALRASLPGVHLRAWARRPEAAAVLMERGFADLASSRLEEILPGVGLVVLCTPVETMPALAAELVTLQSLVAPGCVVTDVGSVKTTVVTALEDAFARSTYRFVGSHPMAGSERAGLEAARVELFQRAACLITPTLFTEDTALATIRAFWALLGCRVLEMSPEEHDRKVARISHLPHVAAAVTALAALHEDPSAAACAGNGFRDTTRVAAGDPALWTGILLENRDEVRASILAARDLYNELLAILDNVDDRALRHFLQNAKTLRDGVV
ncbi:prephenate dehydrogenase/arogenate dehydrogenase family protein [Verrucomicrobium sp. BvORR106]|uniref:prephenate dehydrogenase n=1 Tax=Verrucomicrobium sp. BvORR106 TaxID=1403819 RepID=UPI00068FA864|nr:prephenate dehydrogenase/arogenate dehydrogenase family protein [Verrucomicrobium sp. BvORR106]